MRNYVSDLVSVIIPCFNCEKTIEATIESVLNQSYPKIEIILIDDGSNDNTLTTLQEIEAKDKRIKVLHQENKGVSMTRNNGIENSTGEYVVFIDSDDLIHKDYIKYLFDVINKKKCDTAFCYYKRDNTKNELELDVKKIKEIQHNPESLTHKLIDEKYHIGFTTFIYKNELIEKYKIRFPNGLKTGEDLEFLWNYLIHCSSAMEITASLYLYFNNPNSAVHKVEWSRTESFDSLKRIRHNMKKHNFEYVDVFYDYFSARYIWSYAKTFSVAKRKDLFTKLSTEFDTKSAMKYLIRHCPDFRVKITSLLYSINSSMFYHCISMVG